MAHRVDHSDTVIKNALERVLLSQEFASSPKMQSLLEFIVFETIKGRANTLKGYTIGVEIFDRDETFDPDADSIVRVQMGRLRKYLDHYYLTSGKSDPVHISVPKGTYVPKFTSLEPDPEPVRATISYQLPKRIILGGAVILVFLTCIIGYLAFNPAQKTADMPGFAIPKMSDVIEGPIIAVFPFRNLSSGKDNSYLRKGLAIELISNLSRFKNLSVLSQDTTVYNTEYHDNPLETGRRLGVNHIVTGSYVREKNMLRVTAQLQESPSGRIVWSNSYRRHVLSDNIFDVQARIAQTMASKLGQPYGIINRHARHHLIRDGVYSPKSYICVLSFFDYAHEENAANHLKVRTCLEVAIERRPDYAQAYAALSWMYVDEFRQGFNPRVYSSPPLDRALEMARKAVVLDPDDAFTHRRLANVFVVRGDMELARDQIMKALELNPNNSEVLADIGWIVKNLGDWFTAFHYANKAITLNPGYPPWYLETPFLYYYSNQDCQKSYQTARSFFRQDSEILLPHIFMVVSSALCRKRPDVSAHVRALNTSYPDFLTSPGKTLVDMSVPQDLIPQMLNALLESGVRMGRQ